MFLASNFLVKKKETWLPNSYVETGDVGRQRKELHK